jgi:nucleoside-diphosphate-sugar epimerase
MKRKLYLFTGFGFIGLNILDYLKNDKFKLNIIGRKKKYPFKILINNKKFNIINQNIFDIKKLNKFKFTDSIVVLSTLNSKNKSFQKKFNKLVEFLSKKKLRKVILISSVSIYGNTNIRKIQLKNQYSKNIFFAEKICDKNFDNLKILRVANLFGILRIKPGIIEKIILQYLKIDKFKFFKEDTFRSFVSIDDFVKILKHIINYKSDKKIYNVSNENYVYSIKNFLKIFNKIYGSQIILKTNTLKPNIKFSKIQNNSIKKDFKFKFQKDIKVELDKLNRFYQNYLILKKKYLI